MKKGCAGVISILAQFPVAAVRGTTQECPLECLDGRLRVAEADARPATADRVGLAPAVKLTKLAKRPAPSAPLCAPPPRQGRAQAARAQAGRAQVGRAQAARAQAQAARAQEARAQEAGRTRAPEEGGLGASCDPLEFWRK